MTRKRKDRARRFELSSLGAATFCALVLSACSSAPSSAGHTSTPAGVHHTGTTTTPSTPTAALPPSPRPTADAAANALISAWSADNRTAAQSVASSQAVATLFAITYQPGLAIDRGCSAGLAPVTCTFGPPGGANPNDAIYSLSIAQTPQAGWYVASVQVEG